jgi:hypothetical protein
MAEQRTFASIAWTQKGRITRRERFLAEMDSVFPGAQPLALSDDARYRVARPAAARAGGASA